MKSLPAILLAVFLATLSGCGPEVSQEDLGTVIFDVPKFDPIEKPYPMPKLKAPPEEESTGTDKHDHDHPHEGHDHP